MTFREFLRWRLQHPNITAIANGSAYITMGDLEGAGRLAQRSWRELGRINILQLQWRSITPDKR